MTQPEIGKVTAFITRDSAQGRELLVFTHPDAGIQVPAGTMEAGETPEIAVLREVSEETGLTAVRLVAYLGAITPVLDPGWCYLLEPFPLQSAPGGTETGAILTRGYPVSVVDSSGDYDQVCYGFVLEGDMFRHDLSMTGWLPRRLLTTTVRRHLFHLMLTAPTPDRWSIAADGHTFALYWASLDVGLIPSQREWLDLVRERLLAPDDTAGKPADIPKDF
jgi:8-oxo-dGTP pyrophosphatase MutT (NUDIX family)